MSVTKISDIVEPEVFTAYIAENTAVKSALVASGVMARNSVILGQLKAGADSFTVPVWADLSDVEADIVSDDPDVTSTPRKLSASKMKVRKSFLHGSWSAMNLASELAGADALARIQSRVAAYWTRQLQKRLVGSLQGVLADNVANDSSDMVHDITGATNADITDDTKFSAKAVIDAAAELGDNLSALTAVAMHSDVYRNALKNDLLTTHMDSAGVPFQTFRGLAVIVDDGVPYTAAGGTGDTDTAPEYTSILFGGGAVGYGVTPPRIADGTEVENLPSAGNGGGQQVLHSRVNVGVHPLGFSWLEGSVTDDSPSLAELAKAGNWDRIYDRKHIPLAFLKTNG